MIGFTGLRIHRILTQTTGCSLNLNVHFHSMLLDGVSRATTRARCASTLRRRHTRRAGRGRAARAPACPRRVLLLRFRGGGVAREDPPSVYYARQRHP